MALTTRTEVAKENTSWYDRALLERAVPELVHMRWGQQRNLPMHAGTDTMKFRKYGALTTNTTPLTGGVTPAGKQLSVTDVTSQIYQYGDYITVIDILTYESEDAVLTETALVLGEQAGESLDEITRDVLAAGTTVQYASTATARDEVTSAMKLNRAEVKEAVRTLRGYNAKPVTQMIDPSNGFNTVPVGKSFVGIVSEDTAFDLDDAQGWVPVEKYPNPKMAMPGEIGSLANVRFVMSTKAKVFSGEGYGSVDVHGTIILGQNAYGVSKVAGMGLRNIVKPLGSAGTADPLEQRATSGWKATFAAKILQQTFMVRIEHGVSS